MSMTRVDRSISTNGLSEVEQEKRYQIHVLTRYDNDDGVLLRNLDVEKGDTHGLLLHELPSETQFGVNFVGFDGDIRTQDIRRESMVANELRLKNTNTVFKVGRLKFESLMTNKYGGAHRSYKRITSKMRLGVGARLLGFEASGLGHEFIKRMSREFDANDRVDNNQVCIHMEKEVDLDNEHNYTYIPQESLVFQQQYAGRENVSFWGLPTGTILPLNNGGYLVVEERRVNLRGEKQLMCYAGNEKGKAFLEKDCAPLKTATNSKRDSNEFLYNLPSNLLFHGNVKVRVGKIQCPPMNPFDLYFDTKNDIEVVRNASYPWQDIEFVDYVGKDGLGLSGSYNHSLGGGDEKPTYYSGAEDLERELEELFG